MNLDQGTEELMKEFRIDVSQLNPDNLREVKRLIDLVIKEVEEQNQTVLSMYRD